MKFLRRVRGCSRQDMVRNESGTKGLRILSLNEYIQRNRERQNKHIEKQRLQSTKNTMGKINKCRSTHLAYTYIISTSSLTNKVEMTMMAIKVLQLTIVKGSSCKGFGSKRKVKQRYNSNTKYNKY